MGGRMNASGSRSAWKISSAAGMADWATIEPTGTMPELEFEMGAAYGGAACDKLPRPSFESLLFAESAPIRSVRQ